MGDFLLDFRPPAQRRIAQAAAFLKFFDDQDCTVIEEPEFGLVLTSPDEPELWGPFRSPSANVLVALCGRVALEEEEWEQARTIGGAGGRACKAIFNLYRAGGIEALYGLNGNFVVLVYDRAASTFHLLTDRCGMTLAYGVQTSAKGLVFSSHPDALASAVGEEQNLDLTSLAELLITGRLTFPYTYFQNIRGLDTGSLYTIDLQDGAPAVSAKRQYFRFDFKIDPHSSEQDLAEELAGAFQRSITRRTLPVLGTVGVGLSGGLDSRAILSAVHSGSHVRAFTLFDEKNAEFKAASRLAEACGVERIPIQREFEYYGNSMPLGVKISGGTGSIASNHFLGARQRFRQLGIQNLLTGCYCDYLLKGLSLNTVEQKFTRVEQAAAFNFQFYRPYYWPRTEYGNEVQSRLAELFPEARNGRLAAEDWLNIERKRAFPLAYEADLAQRVIPQRVLPWFLPMVDNEIISLYLRIPSRFKLNASLFKKMVLALCAPQICAIPDNNTGAPLNASRASWSVHRYVTALRNRIKGKILPQMATHGSWPNWEFYIHHSRVIQGFWTSKSEAAEDLFTRILGENPLQKSLHEYRGGQVEFLVRLLTLKLWLDQRAGVPMQDAVEKEVSLAT